MIGDPEITHVSSQGIWLLAGGHEYFLSYEDFPWFREARIGQVLRVEQPAPGHFFWPELDVDLELEAIEHPEKYPLQAIHPSRS
jgi:hypothetical protein